MSKYSIPLNNIKIAAPCLADWNAMVGNDRVRFCGQCSLNVYNLSSMSRREAEDLIEKTEGRLCVRFYKRKDGTIITDNCPVGLRALRRRVNRFAGAVISAVLSFTAGLGLASALRKEEVPDIGVMGKRIAMMDDVGVPVKPEPKTPERPYEEVNKLVVQGYAGIPLPPKRHKKH